MPQFHQFHYLVALEEIIFCNFCYEPYLDTSCMSINIALFHPIDVHRHQRSICIDANIMSMLDIRHSLNNYSLSTDRFCKDLCFSELLNMSVEYNSLAST